MRLAVLIMIATLAAQAPVARAADCSNTATQMDMNACAAADFQAADGQLNAAYKDIMSRLRGQEDVRKQLVASEQAWIRFRDAECSFVANTVTGGSIYSIIVTGCRTTLTMDRLKQFRGYLGCKEGDLSCPLPPR